MRLTSVPRTEATGFGGWYEESGSVSATPALAIAAPTRAVAALSGGGSGADLLLQMSPAGRSPGEVVRLGFRAGEEHG